MRATAVAGWAVRNGVEFIETADVNTAENFEKIASRDRALLYMYKPENDSTRNVWIALEIGSTKETWHSWEGCLITWPQLQNEPPQATQILLQDIQLRENPPLTGRYFVFKPISSDSIEAVLYWYDSATLLTTNLVSLLYSSPNSLAILS